MSHEQSHGQAMEAPPPVVLDHPLVPKGQPTWIDNAADLHHLLDRLKRKGLFAFDSEFIGENSYYPKLCLIQVATDDEVAIIAPPPPPPSIPSTPPTSPTSSAPVSLSSNPPSGPQAMTAGNLGPQELLAFWQLIADPSVEKVVHAGSQDLAPTLRHTGRAPAHIFDVQIAGGFVGLGYPVALGKLALALLNADLGPGLKFSQWDHRPLSPAQIAYAANDVRYLLAMRQVLLGRLETNGNLAWALEECSFFCRESTYRFDAEQARVKARGIQWLTPKEQLILQALLAWRDRTACSADLPARTILPDGVMTELVRRKPKTIESLQKARGLPHPVVTHHGQEILDTIAQARLLPTPPKTPPCRLEDEPLRSLAQSWWDSAHQAVLAREIEPNLLTSKRELMTALTRIHSGQPTDDLRLSQGWRRSLLPRPPESVPLHPPTSDSPRQG